MPDRTHATHRADERGFSLIETTIVAFLTTIILGIFYGSSLSIGKATANSNRESNSRAKQTDVLERIRGELAQTGLDGRFQIAVDGSFITYQKLIGAVQSGAGVSGVWSPSFTITHDPGGSVRRSTSGSSVSWGTGIKVLRFSRQPSDTFITVTCITEQHGVDVTRQIHVNPGR